MDSGGPSSEHKSRKHCNDGIDRAWLSGICHKIGQIHLECYWKKRESFVHLVLQTSSGKGNIYRFVTGKSRAQYSNTRFCCSWFSALKSLSISASGIRHYDNQESLFQRNIRHDLENIYLHLRAQCQLVWTQYSNKTKRKAAI